jgi:hypothetical protein
MKTNLFKSILPMAVMMFGIFAAFGFEKADTEAAIPQVGWYTTTTANHCDVQVNCDDRPSGPLCTAIYNGSPVQAFGKATPSSATCTKTLRMPLN